MARAAHDWKKFDENWNKLAQNEITYEGISIRLEPYDQNDKDAKGFYNFAITDISSGIERDGHINLHQGFEHIHLTLDAGGGEIKTNYWFVLVDKQTIGDIKKLPANKKDIKHLYQLPSRYKNPIWKKLLEPCIKDVLPY